VPNFDWPAKEDRSLISKRISRLDGPMKARGAAKYSYDRNLEGMLFGRLVTNPYAHARIKKIDTSAAEKVTGFRGVVLINDVGAELQWMGQEILAVAADTEEHSRDAARAVKIEYEVLPHFVKEEDVTKAGNHVTPADEKLDGDPEGVFKAADTVTHEGYYGCATINHCCLEPHGQVVDWKGDEITVYASTQAVGRIGADLAKNLSTDPAIGQVSPSNVVILTPVMGGGFGSKFNIDTWGIACAKLSKQTGRPVKLMLDRDEEQLMAGARPSFYGNIKVAAKKDGTLTGYQSETWATGGPSGRGAPPLPYVIDPKNNKTRHINIATHTGPARAWRAPNHPQAAVLTMCALTDLSAKLGMDPLEFFKKNAGLTARPDVYRAQLDKGAELIDWKNKYHKPGEGGAGYMRRGVGLSIHTWGGRPHDSQCRVTIEPDGKVAATLGSQDLGVGLRTVVGIVLAETMGLPLSQVTVNIGDSRYPPSGASGGSTSTGGVSSSTRRGAVLALDELKKVVAADLGATAEELEAKDGTIRVKANPSKSISWRDACRKLGSKTISQLGEQPMRDGGKLADQGVGGAQFADVSVDIETGIVKVNKMVAVQDVGLVIDLKTSESQVYGALIMGICWALWEQRVYDEVTGKMLNPDMEFYKLAGIGDIGELVVHMDTYTYDDRGVIGLGEPPAVSPGAAISNAVYNALGVRVPVLPMTPDKVLAALEKKGGMA
jgi:xanthine dehydrogenase YagR molybdenum-binding subunit